MTARSTDELIAAAIAAGATYTEAAETAGVSRRTVARRMAAPDFRAHVERLSREVVAEAIGILTDAAPSAARRIADLTDAAEDQRVQLSAARAVLAERTRLTEANELADRLAALETAVAANEAGARRGLRPVPA